MCCFASAFPSPSSDWSWRFFFDPTIIIKSLADLVIATLSERSFSRHSWGEISAGILAELVLRRPIDTPDAVLFSCFNNVLKCINLIFYEFKWVSRQGLIDRLVGRLMQWSSPAVEEIYSVPIDSRSKGKSLLPAISWNPWRHSVSCFWLRTVTLWLAGAQYCIWRIDK